MKTTRMIALAVILLYISACQPIAPASLPPATGEPDAVPTATAGTNTTQPLLKTELGDFEIAAARLVDEANGVKPEPGEKLLLLILTQPGQEKLDPTEFSLESFSNMTHAGNVEIYILGDDGSRTTSTMGGWVEDEFAMGFRLPVDVDTYTLYWTGNSPITLDVEE